MSVANLTPIRLNPQLIRHSAKEQARLSFTSA